MGRVGLTTHERFERVYAHSEPDRVPITDGPWESTIARWRREGLPANVDWRDYFGVDDVVSFGVTDIDTSPRFPESIVEESETHRTERNRWGVTLMNFKPISSTPQDIDFAIKGPDTWREAKARMTPSPDRVNWPRLEREYRRWRERGAWIVVAPWFGFDITSARMCGTERILLAMAEDPEWCVDMFDAELDLTLALLQMIWDAGYEFDEFMWFDDMAYRNGLLFSPGMYRELVKPYQQRAVAWGHAKGLKMHLHCCGNVGALVPELIELGVDCLSPLEVKAGMDATRLKASHGDRLVLRGGFDVRSWSDPIATEEEIRSRLPVLKASGGYVFSCDHSIADSVGLDDYARVVRLAKEVGAY